MSVFAVAVPILTEDSRLYQQSLGDLIDHSTRAGFVVFLLDLRCRKPPQRADLDRIVRKRYGKTLHKVIMETRLRSAERMLVTTNMTVQEIGSEVGFSSNAGFYREFSRLYGTTPAEYRKSSQMI